MIYNNIKELFVDFFHKRILKEYPIVQKSITAINKKANLLLDSFIKENGDYPVDEAVIFTIQKSWLFFKKMNNLLSNFRNRFDFLCYMFYDSNNIEPSMYKKYYINDFIKTLNITNEEHENIEKVYNFYIKDIEKFIVENSNKVSRKYNYVFLFNYFFIMFFVLFICYQNIHKRIFSKKDTCDNGVLDISLVKKYDYILDYMKNYVVNNIFTQNRMGTVFYNLFNNVIPFTYMIVFYIIMLQKEKNIEHIALVLDEIKKIVDLNMETIFSIKFDLKKLLNEFRLSCENINIPSMLKNYIKLDTLAISRMISYKIVYADPKDSDLNVIVPNSFCVVSELLAITLYKCYCISKNYKEYLKDKAEKEKDKTINDYLYEVNKEKLNDIIRDISNCPIDHNKYCKAISVLY